MIKTEKNRKLKLIIYRFLNMQAIKNIIKLDTIIKILIIISVLVVSFYNLDGVPFFLDEGDTALIAKNISSKHSFLPKTWDGKTLLTMALPDGHDFNKFHTPLLHTWGQYYLAKLGHLILGRATTFSTRLPFAFFGLLSIAIIYILISRIAKEEKINNRISLLLIGAIIFSYSYFGYIRVARYYSVILFFSSLILYIFYGTITKKEKISYQQMLLFILLGFGLYYFNYLSFGLFTISIWLFLLFQKDWQNLMLFSITNAILAIFVLVDFYIFHLDIILLFKFTGKTLIKHYIQTGFNIFRFMPLIILLPFTLLKDRNNPWGRLFIVSCITIILVYTKLNHNYGHAKHAIFLLPIGFIYLISIKKLFSKYLFAGLVVFFLIITNINMTSGMLDGVATRSFFNQNYYYNDIINRINSLPPGTIKAYPGGTLLNVAFYTQKHHLVGQLDRKIIPKKSVYTNFPNFCYTDYPSEYIVTSKHDTPTKNFNGEKYKLIFHREYKPKIFILNIKNFLKKSTIKQAIYQKI